LCGIDREHGCAIGSPSIGRALDIRAGLGSNRHRLDEMAERVGSQEKGFHDVRYTSPLSVFTSAFFSLPGPSVHTSLVLALIIIDWHWSRFWQLVTDALPPKDATNLAEDLGIELDTAEHTALEQDALCNAQNGLARNSLKRKRSV
jgi:hypothetical protein